MQDYIPRTIDINEKIQDIYVKQFDGNSRSLRVQILDKSLGVDSPMLIGGCRARMYVDKGVKPGVLIDGDIADGDNGIVIFIIPGSVTQEAGDYPCEIRLTDTADRSLISTKPFTLHVEESIFNDDGFEGTEELSALQQALNDVDSMRDQFHTLDTAISQNLDEYAHVKPLYLAEIDGYAAQSIAYIGNGVYVIGFSSESGSDALIMAFNERTKTVIGSASAQFGHVNSLGYDGEYLYSPGDNEAFVNKFKVNFVSGGITISGASVLTMDSGVKVKSIFDHDGEVYAFGKKDGESCFWKLNADEPEYTSVALPLEAPRTEQTWAADGTYLYWLRSNPNAVAVFDFASGEFIRWSGIGDFVGGSMMIGEVEMLCFAEGKARLISQYYYPNSISTAKRFWLFSSLMWSKELPPDQQHWYPNEHRKIYVSNANPGGVAIRTNQGDDYSKDAQIGTERYPYPSFETAFYAAMATPDIPNEIIMLNTGTDYRIEDVVFRIPGMNIIITCLGKVTFEHIHLPTGILTVTGNCYFERITTTNRSILQISDGTFASKSLIDGAAPYQLGGTVSITNGRWYKSANQSDDILFEFAAGANGVVGFNTTDAPLTDSDGGVLSAPRSNSIQQLNLTLYNVRNAGRRDRWTAVYSGDTDIQIGNVIPTTLSDFYVNDGIVCRVKWRAENGEYYNAIAHVNGDTVADLSAMAGTGTDTKYRVVKMRFRPRIYDSATGEWINGDIRVMSVTDYSVVQGAVVSTVTDAGSLPAGVEIAEIAVRGY